MLTSGIHSSAMSCIESSFSPLPPVSFGSFMNNHDCIHVNLPYQVDMIYSRGPDEMRLYVVRVNDYILQTSVCKVYPYGLTQDGDRL